MLMACGSWLRQRLHDTKKYPGPAPVRWWGLGSVWIDAWVGASDGAYCGRVSKSLWRFFLIAAALFVLIA